ncbi:uncharacterized protein LOC144439666 [Glandiceps talaboti]
MKIALVVLLVTQLYVGLGPYVDATCGDSCSEWTRWFDRDDPSDTADSETLFRIKYENPNDMVYKKCDSPTAIQVRKRGTTELVKPSDGVFQYFDTIDGFLCLNKDQCGTCDDYEVRFCCSPDGCQSWTEWYDRDNPSITGDWEDLKSLRNENPNDNICASPTALEVRLKTTKAPVQRYGDMNFYKFDTRSGFVCRNGDQCNGRQCCDYEVRYCCP